MMVWLIALMGCSGSPLTSDVQTLFEFGSNVPDEAPVPEAPAPDTRDLVEVSVPREFRGLWVATVANLDFPSRQGLPVEAMQRELTALTERTAALGFNALVFQVRPEGDAFYASELEPWSRYLSGTQGTDPGFDPLAFLISEAHDRGLEVHAWFNPYRAASARGAFRDPRHISHAAPDHAHAWGNLLWLDPGATAVQDHAVAVVTDVVTRYGVDGVHLDDYFYPYPDGAKRFPDERSYTAYQKNGGQRPLDLWRRGNVDTLVHRLSHAVKHANPTVRFGISPFGIYRPGQPEGITGFDQVDQLHADPMVWYEAGYIDYLAPQLYWPTTKQAQRFDKLLDWWDAHTDPARPMLAGLDLTKVGKHAQWPLRELEDQIALTRAAPLAAGHIWFRADPVMKNQAGVADLLATLYAEPALPPPLERVKSPVEAPAFDVTDHAVQVEWAPRRALVLYKQVDGDIVVDRILPGRTERIDVEPGTWLLSQVADGGWESQGVRFEVAP